MNLLLLSVWHFVLSNSSLNEMCVEAAAQKPSLPTHSPLNDPLHTPNSLDFLDQPQAEDKRSLRRNRDRDYACLLNSHTEMANPE